MGIRGTKPMPQQLRMIRGNPDHKKLPDPAAELKVPLEEPTPPRHLSKDAKTEWQRIVRILFTLKLLTALDRAALAAYCQAYGRWAQAERKLAKEELAIMTTGGNAIQNPLVGIANKAMADLVRYAVEFGMTPSARTRLQSQGGPANENPFEAFRSKSSA